jgi:hypothetical protein
MWRFDAENAFLQLARTGLPRMQEMQIDAKKELDNVLKSACFSLKHSAVKVLLGNIDAFLAKVTAFVGEIPISTEGSAADPAAAKGTEFITLRHHLFCTLLPLYLLGIWCQRSALCILQSHVILYPWTSS